MTTARPLTIGSLCTGYGGLDLALTAAIAPHPTRTLWHADNDPAAAALLAHHWPDTPNLGDITTLNWAELPTPDVLTAGYPCQPFSDAGQRKGAADERHIWPHIADAIRVLRPGIVVLENVRGHLGRGFPEVLGDLAAIGYDACWLCLRASDIGAPHQRHRLFAIAHPAHTHGDEVRHQPINHARQHGPAQPRTAGADNNDAAPVADTASRRRGERLTEPSGPAREPVASPSGPQPPHPNRERLQNPRLRGAHGAQRPTAQRSGDTPVAHAQNNGLERPVQPQGRRPRPPHRDTHLDPERWGVWAPAIARWEHITGTPAPDAVEYGERGNRRLAAAFSEWMMGLPPGWVTGIPGITRNQQLRLIGNGVVPQQGAEAIRRLLLLLAAG